MVPRLLDLKSTIQNKKSQMCLSFENKAEYQYLK